MIKSIAAALIVISASDALAGTLYDINFSAPPQVVNQTVRVGLAPNHPTAIGFGNPTVVPAFGHLTSQPLMFDMVGNGPSFYYDQIGLTIPVFSEPVLLASFDFESRALVGSTAGFAFIFDTPTVRTIRFDNTGHITFNSPSNSTTLGTFVDGVSGRVTIKVDQSAHTCSVLMGAALLGSAPFVPDSRIANIRLSFGLQSSLGVPDLSAVGIDNFLITTVPEPGTITLLVLALGVTAGLRRRSQ